MGTETGARAESKAETRNARSLFLRARTRLFDINNWDKYSGIAGANFWLADEKGIRKRGMPRNGDHIVIDLPGPGPKEGNGFDWVRIDDIQDKPDPKGEYEFSLITVRPCSMPGSYSKAAAHFYKKSATSTFIVERKGSTLIAEEKGKNEIANNSSKSWFDKIRNLFTAFGARTGASQLQWQVLMKNFLEKED